MKLVSNLTEFNSEMNKLKQNPKIEVIEMNCTVNPNDQYFFYKIAYVEEEIVKLVVQHEDTIVTRQMDYDEDLGVCACIAELEAAITEADTVISTQEEINLKEKMVKELELTKTSELFSLNAHFDDEKNGDVDLFDILYRIDNTVYFRAVMNNESWIEEEKTFSSTPDLHDAEGFRNEVIVFEAIKDSINCRIQRSKSLQEIEKIVEDYK